MQLKKGPRIGKRFQQIEEQVEPKEANSIVTTQKTALQGAMESHDDVNVMQHLWAAFVER